MVQQLAVHVVDVARSLPWMACPPTGTCQAALNPSRLPRLCRFACPVSGHCDAGMKIKFTAS